MQTIQKKAAINAPNVAKALAIVIGCNFVKITWPRELIGEEPIQRPYQNNVLVMG
jgi:hypothetical protein